MAADVTSAELDRRLTEKLGERYLEIQTSALNQEIDPPVREDGAVKQAGTFPIMGPMTPCRRCLWLGDV